MTRAEKKAAKLAEQAAAAALLTQNMASEAPAADVIEAPAETPSEPSEIVEDVVSALEAVEGASEPAPSATEETPAPETPQSFDDKLKAITDEDALAMAHRVAKAIDERKDFEKVKDVGNGKIQKTLDNVRKRLITLGASRVLIATNVEPEVLNRSIHENSRYNVYAMQKLADAAAAVGTSDGVKNAINNACMRSLFRFRAAGMTFTGEMAKAAASDKIKVEASVRDHLVRHTVDGGTAPTQASSTMQALETLGIVTRSGSGKNPTFTLSANPIVEKLEQVLAA